MQTALPIAETLCVMVLVPAMHGDQWDIQSAAVLLHQLWLVDSDNLNAML